MAHCVADAERLTPAEQLDRQRTLGTTERGLGSGSAVGKERWIDTRRRRVARLSSRGALRPNTGAGRTLEA